MHYIRMRTARFLPYGDGGLCPGGVSVHVRRSLSGGGSLSGKAPPPVNRMTDRQVYKQYLPTTSFAGGNDTRRHGFEPPCMQSASAVG